MKKAFIVTLSLVLLVAVIAGMAVFFGNDGSKINDIFYQTVESLDKDCSGLKSLLLDDAKKYCKHLDENIDELKDFYEGSAVSPKAIENFTVFHETDNIYTAYGVVPTDAGKKYFVCIQATGARIVDAKGVKQIIVEDYDTFKGKKVIENKKLKDYQKQARVVGVTVRPPGDHGQYAKENKEIEELMKKNK